MLRVCSKFLLFIALQWPENRSTSFKMHFLAKFPGTNGLGGRFTVCYNLYIFSLLSGWQKEAQTRNSCGPWYDNTYYYEVMQLVSCLKNAKFPQVSNNQRQIASQFSFKKKKLFIWIGYFELNIIFVFIILPRYLPREVDPLVYNMSHEDPGNISYSEVGGLSEQIRELREVPL